MVIARSSCFFGRRGNLLFVCCHREKFQDFSMTRQSLCYNKFMKAKRFEYLIFWQRTRELTKLIYQITNRPNFFDESLKD